MTQISQITASRYGMERDGTTFEIIGCAMEVHRALGPGFLESVYQDALAVEFEERRIPFQREAPFPVVYRGRTLGSPYRADFVVSGVLLELKAVSVLTEVHSAQLIHYLRASGLPIGLLLNFSAKRLDYKRFILSPLSAKSAESAVKSSVP